MSKIVTYKPLLFECLRRLAAGTLAILTLIIMPHEWGNLPEYIDGIPTILPILLVLSGMFDVVIKLLLEDLKRR